MGIIEWDGDNFLEAFDSGYKFSEADLAELVSECSCEEFSVGNGRWVEYITSIMEFENRFFAVPWSRALTELQSSEYPYQPIEVNQVKKKVEATKVSYLSKRGSNCGELLETEEGNKYYL